MPVPPSSALSFPGTWGKALSWAEICPSISKLYFLSLKHTRVTQSQCSAVVSKYQ